MTAGADGRARGRMATSTSRRAFEVLRHGTLLLWTFVALLPIYWMLITSFKGAGEWMTWPPHWVPFEPTWINYSQVLSLGTSSFEMGRQTLTALKSLADSLIIATTSSAAALILGGFMAYSISRFATGGRNFPYMILTVRMLPPIVIAVPFLVYYATLGLTDTYLGLILVYTATSLPYVIWMMLSFIDEVPRELEHAARVLGASRFLLLRRIVLPLVASGIVVTFLFTFILNWSEFLLALSLTHSDVTTMPVQLSKYQSANEGRLYGPQAAIGTIATLPVVLLGFLIQRHLVKGFSFGMIRR